MSPEQPVFWVVMLLVAAVAGLFGWVLSGAKARRTAQAELDALRVAETALRAQLDAVSNERADAMARAEQAGELRKELGLERGARDVARREAADLRARVAQLEERLQADREEAGKLRALERQQADEKLALLSEARESLVAQFKVLASDILEDKSKRFTEQNETSIGALLKPVRERMAEFQAKVELFYGDEKKERGALSQELAQLKALNQVMSAEARNLTQALKGSAKVRGNWGETILQQLLEHAGLQRGIGYEMQHRLLDGEGRALIADYVIRLPGDKHLVVDSKLSLIDYERAHSAATEDERNSAHKRHVQSIRSHMTDLSGKGYHRAVTGQGLDYVLMFVPIDGAFHTALSLDERLYYDAMDKNVLLVSPLTLISVVRLIEQLWRQDKQKHNTLEIFKRGGELYDKLADFVKHLEGVGKSLRTAQDSYDTAFKLLSTGRGNAIRQAELLRELGVKSNKGFSTEALADFTPAQEGEAPRDPGSRPR